MKQYRYKNQSGEYMLSWDEVHSDSMQLAERLLGQTFDQIVAITRGGMIPAAILARELGIRRVDTLCISSYSHTEQSDIAQLKDVQDKALKTLVVDDLVDTGETAVAVRKILPDAKLVTLYAKPKGEELTDDYIALFEQDCWLHFPWDSSLKYQKPLAGED